MKIKKIGTKISLQVMVLLVFIVIIVFSVVLFKCTELIHAQLELQAVASNRSLLSTLESYKTSAVQQAAIIARDHDIIEGVQKNNAEQLVKALSAYKLDFVTVCDPQGNVIIRSHSERKGDDVSGQIAISEALRTGKGISTLETGSEISLSIRGSAAIMDENNNIIGALTGGYDLSRPEYVDMVKNTFNCDVTIFMGDERFNSTLLDASGNRAIGTKANEDVAQQVLVEGNDVIDRLEIFDVSYMVYYTPLVAQGQTVGMLFSGVDISPITSAQKRIITSVILLTIAFLVIAYFLLSLFAHKFIASPLKKLGIVATRLEQGDIGIATNETVAIDIKSQDEIGVLARALENTCLSLRGYIAEIDGRMQDLAVGKLDTICTYDFQGDFIAIKNSINKIFKDLLHCMV